MRRPRERKRVEKASGATDEKVWRLPLWEAHRDFMRAKHADFLQDASPEGALVFMSGWMGVDLSEYDLDEPIGNVKSNAIQSTVSNFQAANDDGEEWVVRDIGRHSAIGGLGPLIVGGPEEIADELQAWVDATDVDGFNLAYAITPGTFEDIVKWVIPELRRRGVYPEAYAPGTLRQKLHGRGDRLPTDHHGSRYTVGQALPVG